MHWSGTEGIVDYTTVPIGLRVEGHIWTGSSTTVTAVCPKCGRTGLNSAPHHNKQIVVHMGRASADRLEGTDYCQLSISTNSH
jgi:hypothetical protein